MSNPATNTRPQSQKTKSAAREKEFREALERVYQKYGNNLLAFLHDVNRQKALTKRS